MPDFISSVNGPTAVRRLILEHLASCATCRRRTLHQRFVTLDAIGNVVSDESICVPCTDRAAGPGSPSPMWLMKQARASKPKSQRSGAPRSSTAHG
jgi:hypothetical protein